MKKSGKNKKKSTRTEITKTTEPPNPLRKILMNSGGALMRLPRSPGKEGSLAETALSLNVSLRGVLCRGNLLALYSCNLQFPLIFDDAFAMRLRMFYGLIKPHQHAVFIF